MASANIDFKVTKRTLDILRKEDFSILTKSLRNGDKLYQTSYALD